MGISLVGVRIKRVLLERQDDGTTKLSGAYELMSSTGKVLATQSINGYGDVEIKMTGDGDIARDKFLDALTLRINQVLGLEQA